MLDQGRGGPPPLELLVARVRGEYSEMPGLRVTLEQASTLWQVDPANCEMLLDRLVQEGFLRRRANGYYVAAED
jgi:hypothetical protein